MLLYDYQDSSGNLAVISFQFYQNSSQNMEKSEIQDLFVDLMDKCPRKGIECIRKKCNGKPITNHTARTAFTNHGIIPRRHKGAIVFPSRKAGGWVAIYMKKESIEKDNRQAVIWDSYTQPQKGGNFRVGPKVRQYFLWFFAFILLTN